MFRLRVSRGDRSSPVRRVSQGDRCTSQLTMLLQRIVGFLLVEWQSLFATAQLHRYA
ncbi:MAG: hypothetical protein HC827_01810 [Cyanobacteria bacterium RM1_2_2]|nr:hypothetical protein [Cyanobacteria bacterium RM1_2_2]